jgi:protein involved in polysaccharide export with SLBB domain
MLVSKKILLSFSFIFFSIVVLAQPVTGQDPSNGGSDMPSTSAPASDVYNFLKDKNKTKTGADVGGRLKEKIDRDSLVKDNKVAQLNPTEQIYGMQLFQGSDVATITELSTPPLDYPIGVYDQIIVSLWNRAEATLDYTVARDGSIFPASIGKIYLQGLTFENVRSLLIQRFKMYVPEGTNIAVSIGQPRTISVNVAGEVNKQGPVVVSAFSNAFNIIAKAGGPTNLANLRSILIKRNGRVIDELDVYKYLTTGDFGKHIYLDNNDFVIIQTSERKVKAEGRFKRPMFYQLKKDENFKALLKYSGGLEKDAFSSGVKIYRTELEQQKIKDVNATPIINPTNDPRYLREDYPLVDGDVVKVIQVNPGLFNKVEIKGEVSYPGIYEVRKNDKLFDLINRAGGITVNTYIPRAYIFRGGGDSTNIKTSRVEVSLSGIASNDVASASNVPIYENDQILLFSNAEFGERQYVEIFGEVRKPGKVNRYGGMTLQDLFYLSGGLKQSAEYARVEIARVIDIDSAKKEQIPTRTILKTFKVKPNLELDSTSAEFVLQPYDQIYVRKSASFELQQLVQINGMVIYPGPYPRLDKYERLSSYIQRSGGVKENADLTGAILFRKKISNYRENVVKKAPALTDSMGQIKTDSIKVDLAEVINEPVSIDLGMALKYKNSKHDVILQEGDVVFIPEVNPFVSVEGVVQSPLKLTFDKEHTNLGYYIDKAGGYAERPWRKRIYITYANGKSKRTINFAFMRIHPRVKEGCVIHVPFRPEGKEILDILSGMVTSAVTVATAAIIANSIR